MTVVPQHRRDPGYVEELCELQRFLERLGQLAMFFGAWIQPVRPAV